MGDMAGDSFSLITSLGKGIGGTLLGIVLFLVFHNIIIRFIAVGIVAWAWGESDILDTISCLINRPKEAAENKEKVDEFYSIFQIMNGHIIMRNMQTAGSNEKCGKCGALVPKEVSFCPHCGTKIGEKRRETLK